MRKAKKKSVESVLEKIVDRDQAEPTSADEESEEESRYREEEEVEDQDGRRHRTARKRTGP